MQTFELDVAYDETLEDALATIPKNIAVTYRVVDPNGPGGGWPVIAFTGKRKAIKRLVREWYSPDDQETAEFILNS
jgi:hypothetical protein